MKTRVRKAQSVLEYALIIITVTLAFMAMNVYLQRAVGERLRQVEHDISPPIVIQ